MPAITLQDRVRRVIGMQKARGQDRRKWNSRRGWGLKLPDGFNERRRRVERRMPVVGEGSLDEFERLTKSLAQRKNRKPIAADPEIGSAGGPASGTHERGPAPSEPDEHG